MRKTSILCLSVFCCAHLLAQDKAENRFKKITPADFTVSSPVVDSNSNAVILADVGVTDFVGNNSGDFSLVFKRRKRVLLRNRNSFDEATVKVPVYLGPNYTTEERFEEFEATTYNLENGEVVATRMDKNAVFSEKVDREHSQRKFTFANIKEGSIIEYQYTIKSPFYSRLRAWNFQGDYPCLWSEYTVTIPSMFNYLTSRIGFLPFTVDTAKKIFKSYTIIQSNVATSNELYKISGDAIVGVWAIKNVPAFKEESYISSPRNALRRIEFQLRSIKYSESNTVNVVKDWYATSADLMKDADFGLELTQPNGFISDIVKQLGKTTSGFELAKKVYEYVRDNYKCTDHDSRWLSQPLKKTYQTRTGNVADLNILLTAILRERGFAADPVLLSTKDNGFANETTPLLSQYNYVLSRVNIDSVFYLLDASLDRLGFGKLSPNCYNNSGRIINPSLPILVNLSPDSLKEAKVTSMIIVNTDSGKVEGRFTSNLGYMESLQLRNKLGAMKHDEYFREIKKDYPPEISLHNLEIDSLKQFDSEAAIHYDMKFNFGEEDIIYFNPLFSEAWKKNPFSSEERIYPVEMPYRFKEVYVLTMDIPKGYKIDEMPKSTRVKLNEDEGMFEYLIVKSSDGIQLRSTVSVEKAVFSPDDYQTLRDFFAFVVKKQAEQIVFKKIN